jgi:hypothetical protein
MLITEVAVISIKRRYHFECTPRVSGITLNRKIGKINNFKSLGASNPKGLHRIGSSVDLCQRFNVDREKIKKK